MEGWEFYQMKKSLSRGSFRTHDRVIGNKNFFIFGLRNTYVVEVILLSTHNIGFYKEML